MIDPLAWTRDEEMWWFEMVGTRAAYYLGRMHAREHLADVLPKLTEPRWEDR